MENTVGKGKNAENQQFLLFPQGLYPIKDINHHLNFI